MDRSTVRNAVLALIGIVAVSLTAATLPTAIHPDQHGAGGRGPAGPGGDGGVPIQPPREGSPGATIDIPFLSEVLTAIALLALIAVLVYAFTHWRTVFYAVAIGLGLAVVTFVLFQVFSPDLSSAVPPSLAPRSGNASAGGGNPDAPVTPPFASILAILVLGLAVLGAVVAVSRRSSENASGGDDVDDLAGVQTAMGRSAGRAVDRIEATENVENEVHRAWREMTDLLDLSRPETNTSGEFETAAIDAGMDPEDVHRLTALFDEVRYGEYDPSPPDERQAIELFERIETRYGENDP